MNYTNIFLEYRLKAKALIQTGQLYSNYVKKLESFIQFIEHKGVFTDDDFYMWEGYINKIDYFIDIIDDKIINRYLSIINIEENKDTREERMLKMNKHFEVLMEGFNW